MNKFKPLLVLLLVLLVAIGAFRLIKSKKAALNQIPPPIRAPLPVNTAQVREGRLELREHYLGTIVPLRAAQISTRLSGYVLKITKYEGDQVKRGELLVEIDSRSLKAKLAGLKAALRAAEGELLTREAIFKRNQRLLAHEAISQEAFDLSKSAFELAQAKVVELRQEIAATQADLSYACIHAPFSGVVTKRFKNPGDLATPGAPILTLEAPGAGYRVLVKVPQERAGLFSPGQTAYLLGNGQEEKAKVFRVYPAVGAEALATVEIRIPKRPFNLPSGASVGVDLVSLAPQGFILPLKALVQGEKPAVYVVRKGRLVLIPIRLKGQSKDQIVASGALKPGERVVIGDPGLLLRLHPGQRVLAEGI